MDALGIGALALRQRGADTWLRCNGRDRMDAWDENICIGEALQTPEKTYDFLSNRFIHLFNSSHGQPTGRGVFLGFTMKNFPKNKILISENRSPFCAIQPEFFYLPIAIDH